MLLALDLQDHVSALAFSARLAPAPFHCVKVFPVSRMNASPELSDATDIGTFTTRTFFLPPLTCSSLGSYASRSTWTNAESTPPSR